jgi:NhaP-type Na+/H+ or K+/H+ antiporter
MTIQKTFITVTAAALGGMFLGGLFGFAAGKIASDFFRHVIPWQDVEPGGFATFCGATVGVVLGGGLGCFGVILQFIIEWRKKP